MWQKFPSYEKLLWSIVWKWSGYLHKTYEPTDLFNELTLVYAHCYEKYPDKDNTEFARILWKSCWNRMVRLLQINTKVVIIDILDVVVSVPEGTFNTICIGFFKEELQSFLKTEEGSEILDLLFNHTDALEKVHNERTIEYTVDKRKRDVSQADLTKYFVEVRGWPWKRYQGGIVDVQIALKKMSEVNA